MEEAYLDDSVGLSTQVEGLGVHRLLEVLSGVLIVVHLGEDHAQFEEDFRLLVELRRHLKHRDEG